MEATASRTRRRNSARSRGGLPGGGRSGPEGAEAIGAADGGLLVVGFHADEFGEGLLGFADGFGMAGLDEAGVDFAPGCGIAEGGGEARPVDHHDLLGVAEAGADFTQAGVAFVDALHGFDDADGRAIDIGAAEIEEEALADGDEAQDDDIVRTDG